MISFKIILLCIAYIAVVYLITCFFKGCYCGDDYDHDQIIETPDEEDNFHTEGFIDI